MPATGDDTGSRCGQAVDAHGAGATDAVFTADVGARRAEFVPQLYDLDAGRVVDVDRAVAGGADLAGVGDRIRDVVLSRGAAQDGLVLGE